MGAYINPSACEKEEFLREKAKEVTVETVKSFNYEDNNDCLPVVLVNNGAFTAGAIAYSARERDAFLRPDGRPKNYYIAKIEDLLLVSNLRFFYRGN
jgi:hypothetical protein